MPISWPPATRMPFTRQITGFLQLRMASTMRVEQVHVLAVLVRALGVVLGVLHRVAAGAERLVADAGEDHGDDAAVAGGVRGSRR